jgi:FixJ family two-component response regulator
VKEAESVVFVDDDSSVREAIKSLITSVGLRVDTALHGDSGWKPLSYARGLML